MENLKVPRWRGYHMVSGVVDVGLFRSVAMEDVKRFKIVGLFVKQQYRTT